MHKHSVLTYCMLTSVLLLGTSSCYQKNSTKEKYDFDLHKENEDDTLSHMISSDSISYVDTFKLVPVTTVIQGIQNNAKKKVVFKFPTLIKSDSLTHLELMEHLALSNLYVSVGEITKNKGLVTKSTIENQEVIAKLIPDTLSYPIKQTTDSLNNWTESVITEFVGQNEFVYFEAIQWLEQMYLTIENPINHRNKNKLRELVELQFENGTHMLERLSMYQEYQPIVEYVEHLITILDCKYFDFNVDELKGVVIDAREAIYVPK